MPPGGDIRELVELARATERAGWDGFFLWDHVYIADGLPLYDPWVVLGAIAAGTERIRLGAMVTPVARRRPWKLAKEIATLDHLSAGRVIVGAGLGVPDAEFTAFGEPADPRERAAALDEGLELLDGFLRGTAVEHDGPRYRVRARLTPACVQRPRPPIWVAATWPHRRPLARAARYDGVFAIGDDAGALTPDQVRTVRAAVGPDADVVVPGVGADAVAEYTAAGATWLVTGPDKPGPDWPAGIRAVTEAGPPADTCR